MPHTSSAEAKGTLIPRARERDPAPVCELYHLACEEISGFCPKAAELLEDAELDASTYLDFSYPHHRSIRANTVQERWNRELKRHSDVV